jgi:hypothetical protein
MTLLDRRGHATDRAQRGDKFRRGFRLPAARRASQQMQLKAQAFFGIHTLQYKQIDVMVRRVLSGQRGISKHGFIPEAVTVPRHVRVSGDAVAYFYKTLSVRLGNATMPMPEE